MVLEFITGFVQGNPRWSIILFALIVTLFITVVNYFVIDRERMRHLKTRQKELQEEMKVHKDNHEKLAEINQEMMKHIGETMRHSFKPMLITLVPLLIFFYWLRQIFAETIISGSWIWYYIGFSFIFSMIFRKLFKLD